MYAEAFGLREEPFAPTPDPAYLVLTPDHREALAALEYGLLQRRGFISLIGEVGTGKTTLLYTLMRRISAEVDTAFFSHTTLGFEDLLWSMLRDLGIEPPSAHKRDLVATLDAHLHRQADAGRTTALIIDESQNLSLEVLEELRLLSNVETYRHKLLQIVLVGQPELDVTLAQPRVRQLRDRIAVRARLRPLPPGLVPEYIHHRLAVGGCVGADLFRRDAMEEIARFSAGVPRRINALCHGALLNAYGRREAHVDRAAVRAVARELGYAPPARYFVRDAGLARSVVAFVGSFFGSFFGLFFGLFFGRAPRRRGIVFASALAMLVLAGSVNGAAFFGADTGVAADVPVAARAAASAREAGVERDTPASSTRSPLLRLLDWMIPSTGYQEWQRMHRRSPGARPDGGWSG